MQLFIPILTVVALLSLLMPMTSHADDSLPYDPLRLDKVEPIILDLTVHDEKRERDLPIRIYSIAGTEPSPVVLFSHGLGGSREGSGYLGKHWAARGYIVVFLQHPGSDQAIWKNKATRDDLATRFNQAANVENYLLRMKDVPAVLDQLTIWHQSEDHPLAGKLDLSKVGMSGHSFGALTTQALSGQRNPQGKKAFTDPRIRAAIPMSPSSPQRGTPEMAFGKIDLPWLLMTGTKDTVELDNQRIGSDLSSRLNVFPALPPGEKYELILHKAEHSAFTDRPMPGDQEKRNPNHHRTILALSTAFWDAFLRNDPAAREYLDGEKARSTLEAEDSWRRK